jgi:2,3-bisphosphoglycerate-independent phosphoglycerate mutase
LSDKKAVLIIVDGMSDRPLIEHEYRTPLEFASTPNIDRLAKGGLVGLLDPIAPGIRTSTDVAALALFGYNPEKYYTGRGGFEALGAGVNFSPNDVAFRCNFATVDDDFRIVDRRAGRVRKGTSKFGKSINEIKIDGVPGIRFVFKPTVEHRGVLVLKGNKLSRMVSDTDPKSEGMKVGIARAKDGTEEAKRTAMAVNEFVKRSHEVLREHPVNHDRISSKENPANIIITRGAGTMPELPNFKTMHDLRGACISGTPVINGIAMAAGLDIVEVKGATGGLKTDYQSKAKATIDNSRDRNFMVVHVKAPDIAGHDADFKGKIRTLEEVDGLVGSIIDEVDIGSNYVCLTSDHATPVGYAGHTGDPVPIIVGGPDVPASRIQKLSEATAARGNLGRIRGMDLMPVLTDLMGRSRLYGS